MDLSKWSGFLLLAAQAALCNRVQRWTQKQAECFWPAVLALAPTWKILADAFSNSKKKKGEKGGEESFNKHSVAGTDMVHFLRTDSEQWIYLEVLYSVK